MTYEKNGWFYGVISRRDGVVATTVGWDSKLYFCGHKSNLPPPVGKSARNSLILSGDMEKRSKIIKVRLSEQEFGEFKRKAAGLGSRSAMVRKAVEAFRNEAAVEKFERMKELDGYFKKVDRELSAIGNNLNQTAKRVNELQNAYLLTGPYVQTVVLPLVEETLHLLSELKLEFYREVKSTMRE